MMFGLRPSGSHHHPRRLRTTRRRKGTHAIRDSRLLDRSRDCHRFRSPRRYARGALCVIRSTPPGHAVSSHGRPPPRRPVPDTRARAGSYRRVGGPLPRATPPRSRGAVFVAIAAAGSRRWAASAPRAFPRTAPVRAVLWTRSSPRRSNRIRPSSLLPLPAPSVVPHRNPDPRRPSHRQGATGGTVAPRVFRREWRSALPPPSRSRNSHTALMRTPAAEPRASK